MSNHIAWQQGKIESGKLRSRLRQNPVTLWLTGLSGAGKSTLAFEIEHQLFSSGYLAYVLDGDNVRHGLNRDLGFSPEDRKENIRRVAEVARLFNDAGLIVITALISPFAEDRSMAHAIIGEDRFFEIHLSTNLDICESRDPKGLYKKARTGAIAEFTGISSTYETPQNPHLSLDTDQHTVEACVHIILSSLEAHLF